MASGGPRWLLRRPSPALGWSVSVLISLLWALLRLVVFQTVIFPLTYVLPLLVCIWTRDTVMLWTMAAAFAVLHTVKQWVILPRGALPEWADWTTYLATLFNISVAGMAVHAVIVLRDRLEKSLERVQAQAEELERQNEELSQQSEELAAQSEELSQQNEELSQQSEELTVQNDELRVQSEEIQALNGDLAQREALLQVLFDAVRLEGGETAALQHVCRSAIEMLGAHVSTVVIYETSGPDLVICGAAGLDEATANLEQPPAAHRFAKLVIDENRTACLNDASLRPDLELLDVPGHPRFQAVLGSPFRDIRGGSGALMLYSRERHEWTTREFNVAEWLTREAVHVIDVFRLQENLRRHAALLDLSPDGVFIRRTDGTITFWAAGAERLYGFTKQEAIGARTDTLLRTRFSTAPPDFDDQLGPTGWWTGELVHTAKDGREIVVESRWLGRHGPHGRVVEILESNVDVTERKRAEEALREADRRKNEFLATLSHELRNPLVPIRYALELMDGGGNDTVPSRPRRIIERQVNQLVRLVDDLLDITRVASNKVRLRVERVSLTTIVEHAVEATAPEVEQSQHSLTVSLPDEPIWLDGDAARLSQVLTNLLTNAIRYTPSGGRITLSAAQANGDVAITVGDTGIGLTPEDAARVFEMFAQVGEPGHGGLGIGLALVKGLVELHGGSVDVRSAGLGSGCQFIVRLPRAAAAGEAPEECAADVVDGPRQRVLVVDDNVDSADMFKTYLEMHGHEVHVAYTGPSALATALSVRPDVGLFDIGLPGMSGYELAERLRSEPATTNMFLVAVTGWGQDDDRERARASGFDAHLTKPTEPDAVRLLLARAAERLRA